MCDSEMTLYSHLQRSHVQVHDDTKLLPRSALPCVWGIVTPHILALTQAYYHHCFRRLAFEGIKASTDSTSCKYCCTSANPRPLPEDPYAEAIFGPKPLLTYFPAFAHRKVEFANVQMSKKTSMYYLQCQRTLVWSEVEGQSTWARASGTTSQLAPVLQKQSSPEWS